MDHSRSIEIVKLFPYYFFFGFYIVLSALQVSSLRVNKYDAKMQKKIKKNSQLFQTTVVVRGWRAFGQRNRNPFVERVFSK